jgi:hypothetical protein
VKDEYSDVIQQLAALDWSFDALVQAGAVSASEEKAYQAKRSEVIAELDGLRGTVDATYQDFRAALEGGAGCRTLFEIRNRMHPKDELKEAANEDLRGVGCYSPRHERRAES